MTLLLRSIYIFIFLTAWGTPILYAADSEEAITASSKTKLSSLLQAWTVNDTTSSVPLNFKLRRAEIKLSGNVIENTRWFIMIDPAKSIKTGPIAATNDNRVLQDLGLGYRLFTGMELVVGQFKTPSTAEGLDPSSELWLPERSLVAKAFGDRREPGVMLTYQVSTLKFSAMDSNGQGANIDDTTNPKDLTLRADLSAFEPLNLGVFTTMGDMSYAKKGRWGANARAKLGDFALQSEVAKGNDSGTESTGWALDASYEIDPYYMPVVRVEKFIKSGVTGLALWYGLNAWVSGSRKAKLQAAFAYLDNISGGNGSPALSSGSKGTLAVLSFQMTL